MDSNDNPPILTSETGYVAAITEGLDINPVLVVSKSYLFSSSSVVKKITTVIALFYL